MKNKQKAIIIGAGPAGLTAAHELLENTDIFPLVLEATNDIGGISKTVNYKGNRIDIGGHRFFSKSKTVMDWWKKILPVQGEPSIDDKILERKLPISDSNGPDPNKTDDVMLIRSRLSRILFLRKFFDYPISLKAQTFLNLGPVRIFKIGISYLSASLFPRKEKSLEDFFINRFGKELYKTFFKDYTEKVWGYPCNKINPDWGAQRIKGLSITKTIAHAIKHLFKGKKSIESKEVETSLIEEFLYPKLGPGYMWEKVAEKIENNGGEILKEKEVVKIETENNKIKSVTTKDKNGQLEEHYADFFISTMPVKDLIKSISGNVPSSVQVTAEGLEYRDFITVGLLLKKLKIKNKSKIKTINNIIPDNWIYIQECDVKLGRLQVFNNWSPYLVKDKENIWLGLEYFCTEGDELWSKNEEDFSKFAIEELSKIGICEKEDVLDSVVIKIQKAYPAYFGSYEHFDIIKNYTDEIENLFLIGRNGMHRYNNMDHSMLSAMEAVKKISDKSQSKETIWSVNAEEEYHETAKS